MPDERETSKVYVGRRQLLVGAASLLSSLFIARTGWSADDAALPRGAPTIYMVSAPDCPYCNQWKALSRPSFEKSTERSKVRFVELVSPSTRLGPYVDAAWPEDLRWIRAHVQEKQPHWGTPLFVLVKGKKVLKFQGGNPPNSQYGFVPEFLQAVDKAIQHS